MTVSRLFAASAASWRPGAIQRTTTRFQSTISITMTMMSNNNAGVPPPLPPKMNDTHEPPPSPPPQQQQQEQPKVARPLRIPTKHSRKKMPITVTDPVMLTEWTQEVLETPDSRLFAHLYKGEESRDAAWETADPVMQKVEALIRGYAYLVPGTIWNRRVPSNVSSNSNSNTANELSASVEPSVAMNVQHELLLKIHNEGYDYMTVRNMKMEERHGPKPPRDPSERKPYEPPPKQMPGVGDVIPLDARKYVETKHLEWYYEHHPEEHPDYDEEQERLKQQHQLPLHISHMLEETHSQDELRQLQQDHSYLHDFASPGPTVNMYDTILDTLACQAATSQDPVQDLATATHVYDMVIQRHLLDGGDYAATVNPHTRPTILTFNAQIRLAADLPWRDGDSVEHRDDALTVATAAFQRTHECGVVERNSASHMYLLQCFEKYMPASRIRGDMAHAILRLARYHGLLSPEIVAAYKRANEPSNAPEYDEEIAELFGFGGDEHGEELLRELPHKWFRLSKKRRYDKRNTVY